MHPTLDSGTVVDRYTVEGVLGEGGMAIVYRVRHNVLNTRHALKILTVGNREVQRRLVQEGELQARLQHPNIVAVTDVLEVGGAPALVMELVDGPSLDQLLRDVRLTFDQADALARGILAGVSHAHVAAGLVHRDLKPGNILLKVVGGTFQPKVADFGLAKVVGGGATSRTRTGSTMGTPHYMSPEQIRDAKNVGVPSDVFATGAILYELVTGRRAFEGEDLLQIFNAVANGEYAHPTLHAPDAPPRMLRAIEAALRVEAEARPPTIAALEAIWTEDGRVPVPAAPFDAAILQATRSLAPPSVRPAAASEDTWQSRAVSRRGTESLDAPSPPPSTGASGAVVAAGLGGVLLAALAGLGVLAVAVLAVVAVVWSRAPETPPPAEAAVGVAPVGTEPAPVAEAVTEPVAEPVAGPVTGPFTEPVAASVPPAPVRGPPAPAPGAAAPSAPSPSVGVAAEGVEEGVEDVPPEPAPAPAPAPAAAPDVPEWTQFLASADPAERRRGVANLRLRDDVESVRLLVRVLREEPLPDIRVDAARAIAWRSDESRGEYAELMAALAVCVGRPEGEALACVPALGRHGESPEQLRKALAHPSAKVRLAALDAAVALAPRAPDGFDWAPWVGPLRGDANPQVAKKAAAVSAALAP